MEGTEDATAITAAAHGMRAPFYAAERGHAAAQGRAIYATRAPTEASRAMPEKSRRRLWRRNGGVFFQAIHKTARLNVGHVLSAAAFRVRGLAGIGIIRDV